MSYRRTPEPESAGDAGARSFLATHSPSRPRSNSDVGDPEEFKHKFEAELAAQALRIFPEGQTVLAESPDRRATTGNRFKNDGGAAAAAAQVRPAKSAEELRGQFRNSKADEGDAGARSYLIKQQEARERAQQSPQDAELESAKRAEHWNAFTHELAAAANRISGVSPLNEPPQDEAASANSSRASSRALPEPRQTPPKVAAVPVPDAPPPPSQSPQPSPMSSRAFQAELASKAHTVMPLHAEDIHGGDASDAAPQAPHQSSSSSRAGGSAFTSAAVAAGSAPVVTQQPSHVSIFVSDVDVRPDVELAKRFAPTLMFDRGERFYPMSAAKFWKSGTVSQPRKSCFAKMCCPKDCCSSSCYGRLCWRSQQVPYEPSAHAAEPDYGSDMYLRRDGFGKCCKEQLCSATCCCWLCCVDCFARKSPPEEHEKAVHFKVMETERFKIIQYYMFYEYQTSDFPWSCCFNQQGSWQHITVVVESKSLAPHAVYFGGHGSREGQWKMAHQLEWENDRHPVCYVAKGSHANYGFQGCRGLCCELAIIPRACCLDNDYNRRLCSAETWRVNAERVDYDLIGLEDPANEEWVNFKGHWGWWLAHKGSPGLRNGDLFDTGDEYHESATAWTRLLGQCFGWCYPKHKSPLTHRELHTKRQLSPAQEGNSVV